MKFLSNFFGNERVQETASMKASTDDWDAPAGAATASREVPVEADASTPAPATIAAAPAVTRESVATVKFPGATTSYPDDTVLDETIPNDLTACHALLTKMKLMPDRLNPDWRLKWSVKERAIMAKINELSNAQPKAHSLKRVTTRQGKIIEQVVAECSKEVEALKARCFEYSVSRDFLHEQGLLPGSAKAQIDKVNAQIGAATSADEIQKLVDRKSQLVAVSQSHEAMFTATRLLNLQFAAMKPNITALERAVEAALSKQDAELVQSEKEFFAGHGLPHQRTPVSAIIAEVRSRLAASIAHYHGATEQMDRMHPSVLAIFDASVFAELLG